MVPPYPKVTANEYAFQFSRPILRRQYLLPPRMTCRIWEATAWLFVVFMFSLPTTKKSPPGPTIKGVFFWVCCLHFAAGYSQ